MKKTYIAPELLIQFIHTEGLIALSKQEGPANGSDALVKEQGNENNGQSYHYNVWDDDWREEQNGH